MNYLILGIGLLILVKGADVLVGSVSKIAKIFKIPAFIVGLFIVAMGTSAPEAAIGVFSGIQGTNLIALGDVVGGSIINITVVIAITAMVFPLKVNSLVTKREIPVSIFIQSGLIIMFLTGYTLSRLEAGLLLGCFFIFFGYIVSKSRQLIDKEKSDTVFENEVFDFIEDEEVLAEDNTEEKDKPLLKLIFLFLLGLVGVIGGANLSVNSAVQIAHILGLSEEFIGLTIVAFGTSLPELVTCLIAVFKKEEDIAVGNIIGSNIINVLFVLGISGLIHPISIRPKVFFDLFSMVVASVLLWIPTFFFGRISRKWGFVFLTAYVIYLTINVNGLGIS
jgi:cation:H+ antiporter